MIKIEALNREIKYEETKQYNSFEQIEPLGSTDGFLVAYFNLIEFRNCVFMNINFPSTEWVKCKFINCLFMNCKLDGCVMKSCELENVNYSGCSFKRGIIIELSKRKSPDRQTQFFKCKFDNTSWEDCDLTETYIKSCKLEFSYMKRCSLDGVYFNENDLEMISIHNSNLASAKFNYNKYSAPDFVNNDVNSSTEFNLSKNEDIGDYQGAMLYYEKVYIMFQIQGLYDKSAKYYLEFRKYERRHYKLNSARRWKNEIGRLFWGYGERPLNIVLSSIILMIFFGVLYRLSHIKMQDGQASLIECIYLSVVTFTTLGDGDFNTKGNVVHMILTGCEAFTGIVFLSIGTAMLYKKITRN